MFKEILYSSFLYTTLYSLNYYLLTSYFLTLKSKVNKQAVFLILFISTYIYAEINGLITPLGPGTKRKLLLDLLMIIYLIINMAYYADTWKKKIFVSGMLLYFQLMSEAILWILLNLVYGADGATRIVQTDWHAGEMGNFIVFFLVIYIRRKDGGKINYLTTKTIILHLSITLLCITMAGDFLYETNLFLVLRFLVLIILFYFYFKHVETTARENYELQLNGQKHLLMEEYYRKIDNYHNEVRIIKHDMKNQLLNLEGYLREENISQARTQLGAYLSELTSIENFYFTSYQPLNLFIGHKYTKAQDQQIKCIFEINLPPTIEIAENDIISLVGNVLDNAIEACEHCNHERFIHLNLELKKGCMLLMCENSTDGKHKSLSTRKKVNLTHGIGMTSIKKIVEKYNGEMDYKWSENKFLLELTLIEC
ncbi:sensor histidine kinase [Enterococcus sp. DIV0756]|uniref:sensor histidine kinase n=1 Tax=Enterococcus sp. DIV0756 TaxID=2774636 RepID=UPI003F296A40